MRVIGKLQNISCAISRALLTWASTVQSSLPFFFMVSLMLTGLVILIEGDLLLDTYSLLVLDQFLGVPRCSRLRISLFP
jgi:hypothetical protein